jgi:hypothetical protein
MSPYAQILRAPWHKNGGEREVLSVLLAIAVVALPVTLMLVALAVQPYLGFKLAVPCVSAALLVVWGVQFSSLLSQNQPTVTRLVPGQLRYLHKSAVALWLAHIAVQATLLGLTFGHAVSWGWAAGIVSLAVACLVYWPAVLMTIGTPLALLSLWFRGAIAPSLQWLDLPNRVSVGTSFKTASLAFVGLLAGIGLLLFLLKSASRSHAASYRQRMQWRRAQHIDDAGPTETAAAENHSNWVSRSQKALYLAWFQHVMRAARPTKRSTMARLELAFGPRTHWTASIYTGVLVAIGLWITFTLLKLNLGFQLSRYNEGYSVSFVVVAFTLVGNFILGLPAHLQRSRHEQALLMLAPGVPQGARLNRGLARRYMARWAVVWVATSLLVAWNVSSGNLSRLTQDAIFICCVAFIPAGLWAWRDWSGASTASTEGAATFITRVLLTIAAVGALVIMAVGGIFWHWPLSLMVGATLAFTLFLGTWLWRQLARHPQALPVGRLAGSPPSTQF